MLFGGNNGSCGGCGCKSCQECTRTCTEPHTGTAFETVYTLYFEGAEAGNPTDGYLDATGDVDTSDPYDGMDGTGPWSQTVSGGFTLTKSTTRYPCYFVASFWRSNFVLGPNTNPPPSADLTSQTITVTNNGPGVLVSGEYEFMRELQPGESYTYTEGIPLVAGSGDQSTNDPRTTTGRIAWRQKCVNETVSFTVTATINWNVKKRQHVLYGLVRECYEDPGAPDPCAGFCVGSSVPDTIYVTITNFALDPDATFYSSSVPGVNGTYALSRAPGLCRYWFGPTFGSSCADRGLPPASLETSFASPDGSIFGKDMLISIQASYTSTYQGLAQPVCAIPVNLYLSAGVLPDLCGTGVLASGANATGQASIYLVIGGQANVGIAERIDCTFDWEISA